MVPGAAARRMEARGPAAGLPSLLSGSLPSNLGPNVSLTLPQGSVSLLVTWGKGRAADHWGLPDSGILWIQGGDTQAAFSAMSVWAEKGKVFSISNCSFL